MKKKQLLVYFVTRAGEYESNDHTVITMQNRESEEDAVHNYFMEYSEYEKPHVEGKADYYEWMMVAVQVENWRVLTDKQYETLQELGLLWR